MRVLSLFSGVGGLDLGFEWAGFETVAFCEIEKYPQEVLKRHWPNVPIIEDVRDVTRESVPGRIDCIIGGFPCQDISYAGKGAGIDYDLSEQEGTRSGLWWEYWRTIRDLRPRYVVAENVSALTNRGLDTVLGSLAQIGYDAEWQIVSAASVGAPHIRERIFIVAYHDDRVGGGGERECAEKQSKRKVRWSPAGHGGEEPEVLAHDYGKRCKTVELPITSSPIKSCRGNDENVPNPNSGRPSGPEGHVDAKCSEAQGDREVDRAFDEYGSDIPDWFAGLQQQPHPVSFRRGLDRNADVEQYGEVGEIQQDSPTASGVRSKNGWVEVERYVRRVADGVSDRIHEEEVAVDVPDRTGRLKGLGNAVVPQVAYLVAMAVRQHAEENGWWTE